MKRKSDADDTSSNKRQEVEYDATFEKITSCKVSRESNFFKRMAQQTEKISFINDTNESPWNQSVFRLHYVCGD